MVFRVRCAVKVKPLAPALDESIESEARDPLTRRHLIVHGRVQGVGFRWFAAGLAEELGVAGWARNREDGTVEIEAEGTDDALERFVGRLRTENPAARVDRVEQRTIAAAGDRGFRIAR